MEELHERYEDVPRLLRRQMEELADPDGETTELLFQQAEEELLLAEQMDGFGTRRGIGRAIGRVRRKVARGALESTRERALLEPDADLELAS